MDIVSRLKLFLQQNGIANSQFADTCDIPRPTLSQLLNGRNKKVSDELITKIHRAYPALNIMWLMFGDGDMFVLGHSQSSPADGATDTESAFAAPRETHHPSGIIDFGAAEPDYPTQRRQSKAPAAADVMQRMVAAAAMKPQTKKSGGADERRVTHMMVFYSDGRFETFVPGNL